MAPTRRNISLKAQSKAVLAEFEQSIVDYDEVMECYLMTGDSDFDPRSGARYRGAGTIYLGQAHSH